MTLQELAGRAAAGANGANWAVRSQELAEAVRRELEDPEAFEEAVSRMAEVAAQRRVGAVLGVSGLGARIAGALTGRVGLPEWDQVRTDQPVLFVDGLVNTGIQLAVAVGRARRTGLVHAAAAGVVARSEALANWRTAGLEIEALEEI